MDSNSPFRFAKHIRLGIPLSPEELKEFQPFLITKLYYYADCLKTANLMNVLWSLPKEMQYKLFCVLFKDIYPKGWIKSTKEKKVDNSGVEYLKKKYQVSTKVATEYLELLTKEERKELKKICE